MKGLLVINHFLTGEKYDVLHAHLVRAAEACGARLEVKTNMQLSLEKNVSTDFVLFWDKDITLARRLERQGLPVFNSAQSVAVCDDKGRTYVELDGIVPQPETLVAPKCYFKSDMTAFARRGAQLLGLPLVFKECHGSYGEQVYLCRSVDDILSHVTQSPFILQRFIAESAGRDRRLEIIDGVCVGAAQRINENDFRSNVTNGGHMLPYTPTQQELDTAVAACNALGLTFGGVDILENGDVCEVNSNAHIINIMNATGTDAAPLIFDAIKRRLEARQEEI